MEGDKEDPAVETADATSVAAGDATDSLDTGSVKTKVEAPEPSADSLAPVTSYQIKPVLQDKFKANPVKEVIKAVLSDVLKGQVYSSESAKKWTIQVADEVNARVRELKMKRYKHIAQVVIGELKGAGVKCGVRCLWDAETDGYTSEIFINDTIFCVCVVFAIYLY